MGDAGGDREGAVAVPLVALATQAGTVELVDAAANAVTSSFAVHTGTIVRGVRWLGNTRLVSFSYTEVAPQDMLIIHIAIYVYWL